MLFDEETRSALLREPPDLVYVDELEVRGRRGRVQVWSLADTVREVDATREATR